MTSRKKYEIHPEKINNRRNSIPRRTQRNWFTHMYSIYICIVYICISLPHDCYRASNLIVVEHPELASLFTINERIYRSRFTKISRHDRATDTPSPLELGGSVREKATPLNEGGVPLLFPNVPDLDGVYHRVCTLLETAYLVKGATDPPGRWFTRASPTPSRTRGEDCVYICVRTYICVCECSSHQFG